MRKLTTGEFKEKLSKTHPNLEVLSEYVSTNKPITVRCRIHDYTYVTTPHRLVQGANCKYCYYERSGLERRKDVDEIRKELGQIHGDKYEYPYLEQEYTNNKVKLTAVCKVHGEFRITLNKLLKGQGCRKCADERNGIKRRLERDTFLKRVTEKHKGKYRYPYIEKEFEKATSIITVVCPEHGEYRQKAESHMYGHGCPKCSESHMERYVSSILKEKVVPQQKFPWLGLQSLDFYLPEHKIGIECQGGQHFTKGRFFGGEEGFEAIRERDKRKYKLCMENGVTIIYVVSRKFRKYLNEEQFSNIYDRNVLILEDMEEDESLLHDLISKLNNIK